jgi:hypothetical protein
VTEWLSSAGPGIEITVAVTNTAAADDIPNAESRRFRMDFETGCTHQLIGMPT